VFFDNLQVRHDRGRIIEENHYYAFGLKIAAISSKAYGAPNNNYGYQGDVSEMDDDLGWNDFELRSYDPQIGRFLQNDPYDQFASGYVGMGNDPVNNIDPSGGWAATGIFQGMSQAGIMATTTLGGAIIGGAIDLISGGDGSKGLMLGAGIGLASNFASAFNWGSVDIGKIASLGLNAANAGVNVAAQIKSNDANYERYLSDDYRDYDVASNSSDPPGWGTRLWRSYQRLDRWAGEHGVDWINENINPITPIAEFITGKQFNQGNFNLDKPRLQSAAEVVIVILTRGRAAKGGRGLWTLTKEGASAIKNHKTFGTIYKSNSDGLWWAVDKAGHGGSKFKVFKEGKGGLEWFKDADEFGNFIINKHKGSTGTFIPWGQLGTVK